MIDPAMCRPGRLDKLLFVDLPSAEERVEIFRTLSRKVPFGGELDENTDDTVKYKVEEFVKERCDGYSGADLAAFVREAGVVALKRSLGALEALEEEQRDHGGGVVDPNISVRVEMGDFLGAFEKVQPSVSVAQRRKYEALRSKFAGLPVKAGLRGEAEK